MSWVGVAVAGAGAAATIGGGIVSRNEATDNARRQAEARNAKLRANQAILDSFAGDNAKTFGDNIAGYAPEAQQQRLETSQGHRGDVNADNISDLDPNSVPITADASPAVRSEIAKRMLAVHNGAVERAKSFGKLGGYTDAWAANELGNQQAARDIGVNNNFAEGRKAMIGPEGDNAAAAAYQTPSIWGPLLQGAGSLASMAGGAMAGGGGSAAAPMTNTGWAGPAVRA